MAVPSESAYRIYGNAEKAHIAYPHINVQLGTHGIRRADTWKVEVPLQAHQPRIHDGDQIGDLGCAYPSEIVSSMLIQNPILSLLSVSLLVPLSLCVPAAPTSFPLSLNSNSGISIGMTSTNPPRRYYQLRVQNDTRVLVFIEAYLSRSPTCLRPIPAQGPIEILWRAMQDSVAHLPPEKEVGKNYITYGPEYRPNFDSLDVRVSIRQFNKGDWEGEDYTSEKLKNKHIAEAAEAGPWLIELKEDMHENAYFMCLADPETETCVGILTLERMLWERNPKSDDDK